jgi:HEAT repeat protein
MQEENRKKLQEQAQNFLIGQGSDPDVVINRLKEIRSLNRQEAVSLLNHFADLEKNAKILNYIIQEIGKYKDKASIGILIDLLTGYKEKKNEYLKVRCTVAGVLGVIKDESAVLPLMYIMNDRDEDYRLRLAAAESLGKIGSNQAVSPLIKIVSDDEEKSVYLKESATKALGMIGDEGAVEPLINLLDVQKDIVDKFTYLKEKIVEVLGKLNFKKDRRIEALRKVLCDRSPHVRASALEALSETEDESVLEYIEPLLKDDNESVAKTAVFAIYNLMGDEYLETLLDRGDLPMLCREEIEEILAEEGEDGDLPN